jgi:hypothetical protein
MGAQGRHLCKISQATVSFGRQIMKTRVMLSIFVLSALALLLPGCSDNGELTPVVEPAAEIQPTAMAEATEQPAGEGGAASSSTETERCADQGTGASMDYDRALDIAQSSRCTLEGQLLENHFCNENSGTWWIDMAADKPGCNPACVVGVKSGAAEINWRCTGVLPPDEDDVAATAEDTAGEAVGDASLLEDEPTPEQFDYTDWGTYRNEEHGYEVKFPPGVTPLWDDQARAVTFEGPLEDNEHWPMFFVGHATTLFYNPDDSTSVREWVESHSGLPENSFSEDIEIAGLEAYHLVQSRSPQAYAADHYYLIKDSQLFSIVILHAGDKQDWPMYNQFLASFTFLELDEPTSSGASVDAWTGVIGANPPGSQSRYFFDRHDGQRWFVATSDKALWPTIAEAAWKGSEVELDGVETPMPGLIDVSSIVFLGEPTAEARNMSPFAIPSASSTLPADRLGVYEAWSVVDGQARSPWCEGADGSGIGQWLRLEFERPVEVTMIQLANGYDYDDDIFAKNNRLRWATFVFSDGERVEWQFDDARGWQTVPLARAPGPNIITTTVEIIVEDAYPGTAYDDTCIGELEIWGRPG